MKKLTATIEDVQAALNAFIVASTEDASLEGLSGKKLAAAVDALTPKDSVTKDLNQAYTHADKKWAMNFADDQDACTKANRADKIKQYVTSSVGYNRLIADPATKGKVEKWLREKFPTPDEEQEFHPESA